MIVDGLSWWQAWLCVWIGYTVCAVFVYTLGRIGAVYHIPFAVANRASFGIWGSFWPILNRAVMAIVWFGVQVRRSALSHCRLLTFRRSSGVCVAAKRDKTNSVLTSQANASTS